jgi:hypothetical protein
VSAISLIAAANVLIVKETGYNFLVIGGSVYILYSRLLVVPVFNNIGICLEIVELDSKGLDLIDSVSSGILAFYSNLHGAVIELGKK